MSPSTEQLAELAPDDTVLVPPHRPKTSQLHPPASPSSAYATALRAVREGATGGELHAPLRQLSLSLDVEHKGPTYKAIEAVLSMDYGKCARRIVRQLESAGAVRNDGKGF